MCHRHVPGEGSVSRAQNYRFRKCTVYRIVNNTCCAIRKTLGLQYMKVSMKLHYKKNIKKFKQLPFINVIHH